MQSFTERDPMTPGFVADHGSVSRLGGGAQVDWASVSNDYIDDVTGKKVLPAGTVVGSLLGDGLISPRVVTTNPAIGILETVAHEDDPCISGYGVLTGGQFWENLLPDATGNPKTLASAVKTELNANGTGFAFQQYSNSLTP
jgi:hypothetical protein